MKLPVFIARRYLFSKKKQNAINIISAISVAGVAVGTTALIVVLSVFNGIDSLLTEATDSFTADILVTPAEGKFMAADTALLERLAGEEAVASADVAVEEKSLVKFGDNLVPVTVKGVGPDYDAHNHISASIAGGRFALTVDSLPAAVLGYGLDGEGKAFLKAVYFLPAAVLGYGIAASLKARLGTGSPVTFYYPNRRGGTSLSSLRSEAIYPIGIFSAQQEIDAKYVFIDIEVARRLFNTPGKISQIELKLKNPDDIGPFKEKLAEQIGGAYKVADKYDANRSFYAMMRSEKLAVFLILLFILFIASFNIVGSVSMLIIDKKDDIGVYQALGMTREKIISIFRLEGNLITGLGAAAGLLIGTGLCLAQEHFGLLTLGEGSYIVSAYPVKVVAGDVLLSLAAVVLIGSVASYFPVKFLVKKIVQL